MHKHYRFCCQAIKAGKTILIYKGVTATRTAHVTDTTRLSMQGDTMLLDGRSVRGYTVCIKP